MIPEESRVSRCRRDTRLYSNALLYRWSSEEEFDLMIKSKESLDSGMKGVIDAFATLHDDGLPLPSKVNKMDTNPYKNE